MFLSCPPGSERLATALGVLRERSNASHTVFENIKWLRSVLCRNRNVAVPSLASLFPGWGLQLGNIKNYFEKNLLIIWS